MEEIAEIQNLTREQALAFYAEVLKSGDNELIRWLGRNDRFFLLGCLMQRQDVLESDWCYARCREVEKASDGYLDLWSRFHYKSTIITLAGSVQEILRNPEITIGVLSYNKPVAQRFVDQIRRALEMKELVKLYPDVLWDKPPRINWSTQGGLIVRRKTNPKEPTISGSGLVDGQPIGMHYALRIYDDVVVRESVTNPEQILKTTEAWELSLALGTDDGGREWYVGTRYHPSDTYQEILNRGALIERRRICVDHTGRSLMMKQEALDSLRRKMGTITWSAQMLQNPVASGVRTFNDNDLCFYDKMPPRESMNVYIFTDGACSKRKKSDRTAMLVFGYGEDNNYYWLDGIWDRLNLSEKTEWLFRLHRKWRPSNVFWEQVGPMSDVEHVRYVQNNEQNYRFMITPLSRGPADNKKMRIENLQPLFESHRMWFPRTLKQPCADGSVRDIVHDFVEEEYKFYPIVQHDDGLDCMADLMDKAVKASTSFPMARGEGLISGNSYVANTKWNAF